MEEERQNLFLGGNYLSFTCVNHCVRTFQRMKIAQRHRFRKYTTMCGYWMCNLSSRKSTPLAACFQNTEKSFWRNLEILNKFFFSIYMPGHFPYNMACLMRIQIFHLLVICWELELVLKCSAFPLIFSTLNDFFFFSPLFTQLCLEANSCWCRKWWLSHSKPIWSLTDFSVFFLPEPDLRNLISGLFFLDLDLSSPAPDATSSPQCRLRSRK